MSHPLYNDTIEILRSLIGFDTTSRDSNLPLVEWVESYLKQYGISSERVVSEDGRKANMLATIGDGTHGILLSGHTDVVPVDDQVWDTAPFTLTVKGNQLFGRGTSDMKSFLACCLAFVPQWKSASLTRPVHLAFSYDEEVGCFGVPHLIRFLQSKKITPALAVIGEPTEMQLIVGHKGIATYETTFTGVEGHSSDPDRGVNAILFATRFIAFLEQLAQECKHNAKPDCPYHPPHTTVHVGVIRGGTVRNIIPGACVVNWEIRATDQQEQESLEIRIAEFQNSLHQSMQAMHPKAGIVQKNISRNPSLEPDATFPLQSEIMQALGTNQTHTISFYTEGGLFQKSSIPSIVVGPGSIKQAHSPNEFIEQSQIELCLNFLDALVAKK